jgi:F-type H+-transporting ATPase subunit epsilon
MADQGYRLTILTEAKAVVDESVYSIIAPGTEGYLGVLRNHAALVTQLQPGKLSVTDLARNTMQYSIAGGFLEVRNNTATILADALEAARDIDLERAERAAARARERLQQKASGLDTDRAEAALKRALNRIRVARQAGLRN